MVPAPVRLAWPASAPSAVGLGRWPWASGECMGRGGGEDVGRRPERGLSGRGGRQGEGGGSSENARLRPLAALSGKVAAAGEGWQGMEGLPGRVRISHRGREDGNGRKTDLAPGSWR